MPGQRVAVRSAGVSLALVLVCSLSCSPKSDAGDSASATGGTPGGGGGSGAGGSASGGVTGSGSGGEGADPGTGGTSIGEIPGATGGAGSNSDASCAGLVLKPEAITVDKVTTVELKCTSEVPQPISIYLVLDNSSSMKDNQKWNDAVSAITAFVNSDPTQAAKPWTCVDKDGNPATPPSTLDPVPASGSISVAIQYFHPQQVNDANECDGTGHATPAVPMGVIPANAQAITNSLGSTGPNGDTPTVGSLLGGTQYCSGYQTSNPDKKCVVVLVTDGQPNGCGLSSRCGGNDCVDPNSAGVLTPIAGNAFGNASNSVVTFTVGMNGVSADGFNLLNQIAVAGGSDCTPGTPGNETCNVTNGGSQAFLDALNTIRKSVQVNSTSSQNVTTSTTETTTLACEWEIPALPVGETFNKELVNITFSTGGITNPVGNVTTEADCAAANGGWHYDDENAPKRIITCPTTCTAIQAATDAKVQVQVGCKTEPAVPR